MKSISLHSYNVASHIFRFHPPTLLETRVRVVGRIDQLVYIRAVAREILENIGVKTGNVIEHLRDY